MTKPKLTMLYKYNAIIYQVSQKAKNITCRSDIIYTGNLNTTDLQVFFYIDRLLINHDFRSD